MEACIASKGMHIERQSRTGWLSRTHVLARAGISVLQNYRDKLWAIRGKQTSK